MRVLHVIPSVAERSGGPATAIVPMCRALQQHGVDVLLVTTEATSSGGKPPFLTCSSSNTLKEKELLPSLLNSSSCSELKEEEVLITPYSNLREEQPSFLNSSSCSELNEEEVLITPYSNLMEEQPSFLTSSSCSELKEEEVLITPYSNLREEQVRKGGLPPLACQYKGVPAIFFQSQFFESFKYSRPLSTWLHSNIQQFDLVHIHAVFNHSSVAAAHVCRKAGVPYVVRPLGTLEPWSMTQKPLRKRVFWQISGKGMLRRAAAVHYTTETEKRSTERLLGLNHGKVIALGVEAISAVSSTSAHHFPSLANEPYALVLSRLHPKKGLDVLIEAFLSLVQAQKFAHWRLVIAGDGPADYVLKLKRLAGSHSQSDRIVFTGWLDGEKKAAVLSGASLLVLPSHQENFGLCVIEALSHSVPVLVSPHVNLAEEIVLANAGWIATVDKNALISRLTDALGDEEERKRRGQAGQQLSKKYSWDTAAKSLVDLYKEAIVRH